jgi:hypothetical protein
MLFELRALLNQIYDGHMSVAKNLFAVSHKLGIPKMVSALSIKSVSYSSDEHVVKENQ